MEVAVGAGANFYFYPKDLKVTAVDFSSEMLIKAKESAADNGIRAEFIQSDIETISFPDNSFDTIVSTLSFCGYDNPVKVLQSFNKWCKTDGQLLLLEHGISSNRLIGYTQSIIEPVFLRVIGCHLERDIPKILEEAQIHIRCMERHMLNTVHLVWASPNKMLNLNEMN